jgi:serine/threonine protein kinase
LGKGGIAVVWLAIDIENGEQVALKQFPKQGGKFDSSAGVEIQIQQVIANAIRDGTPGKSKLIQLKLF